MSSRRKRSGGNHPENIRLVDAAIILWIFRFAQNDSRFIFSTARSGNMLYGTAASRSVE